jgi:aminopeptidase-like protein
VLTCLGDRTPITCKLSRRGDTLADRVAKIVLRDEVEHTVIPFDPFGSDERQYCSPGFNLPVASLMRTRYGRYPEYHTSLDNKDFISFESLENSLFIFSKIVDAFEKNRLWRSTVLFGEPFLSKRTIYPTMYIHKGYQEKFKLSLDEFKTMKWLLNYADGQHDLLDIAERSQNKFSELATAAESLLSAGLLTIKKEV